MHLTSKLSREFSRISALNRSRKYGQYSDCSLADLVKLAIFFTCYSLVTTLLILHYRQWERLIAIQALGVLSYALIFFGIFLAWNRFSKPGLWSVPISTIFIAFIPNLNIVFGIWIIIFQGILGLSLILIGSYNVLRKKEASNVLMILLSIVLGITGFMIINGSQFADVFADRTAFEGLIHRDTLFHSSIISMLAKYGVASTGLDGLKEINYHVGSHRWVANNLVTLGGSAPLLLSISKQVVFISAFFFSMSWSSHVLSRSSGSFFGILVLMFLCFWLTTGRVWDSYLVSESYVYSLGIFSSMIPVGQMFLLRSIRKESIFVAKWWEASLCTLAIYLAYSIKISSGLILLCYLALCITASEFTRKPLRYILTMKTVAVLASVLCYAIVEVLLSKELVFKLFDFARDYPDEFKGEMFFFLAFTLTFWISERYFICSDSTYRISMTIVLCKLALIGIIPGLLFDIGGGSAYYFSHPPLIVSACFAIGSVVRSFGKAGNFSEKVAAFVPDRLLDLNFISSLISTLSFRSTWLLIALLLGMSLNLNAYQILNKKIASFAWYLHDSQTPNNGTSPENHSLHSILRLLSLAPRDPSAFTNSSYSADLTRIIESVDELGLSNADRELAIYISPKYERFWNEDPCWIHAFVVPALLGVPLLSGVRSGVFNCPDVKYYGMSSYGFESKNRLLDNEEICLAAVARGFRKVLEINDKGELLHVCPL